MTRWLLDTDHFTLHEKGHAVLGAKIRAVAPADLFVSIVTVEESLRGRLAVLSRRLTSAQMLRGYEKLLESIRFFHTLNIAPFEQNSDTELQKLLAMKLRIGTLDQRIATIALANGWTVLTRNRRDFGQIPGLTIEDWTV